MNNTPETDARTYIPSIGASTVPSEFARKLERERDEAQKELSSIHRWIDRNHADGFIDSLTYFQNLERVADNWYDRIDSIENHSKRFVRERDEAQHKLEICMAANSDVARIAKERDEARAQNAKLRDIAERAIKEISSSEYGEFSYASAVLRAELNQLKEGAK
jgi:hypothetical protein